MLNLFFLLLSYSIIPASSCPDGWQPSKTMDGKCYLFVYQHEAWHQAESYCTKAAIGGHLTSITSAFENAEILADSLGQCEDYWIGLNDIQQTENFTWIDGQPLKYMNWDSGQPTNQGMDCVSVFRTGKWTTDICSIGKCFFCEFYQGSMPTTTAPSVMSDCYDWLHYGGAKNDGIYQIKLAGVADPVKVWCDMTTDGGGWTVFQRRIDDQLTFYDKTWNDYKYGFNNGLDKNLWLGNEYIHIMSTNEGYVNLRIDIWGDRAPNSQYANGYWWQKQIFWIESEPYDYTLHLNSQVEGNASSSSDAGIQHYDGSRFVTVDHNSNRCTKPPYNSGGWWVDGVCFFTSLNGKYIPSEWHTGKGFEWLTGDYYINPVQSRMMLRRVAAE